jgi:hypothetical protein
MYGGGADVSAAPPAPHTALTFACKTCDEMKVLRLLESKGAVNAVDHAHQSPLLCAVEGGHVLNKGAQASVIKILIDHKADLDIPSQDGRTPIWCACRWGLINVMRQLVQAKADPTKPCAKWGESAIDVAIRYKRVSLLQQVKLLDSEASRRLSQFLRQYSELELKRKLSDQQVRAGGAPRMQGSSAAWIHHLLAPCWHLWQPTRALSVPSAHAHCDIGGLHARPVGPNCAAAPTAKG